LLIPKNDRLYDYCIVQKQPCLIIALRYRINGDDDDNQRRFLLKAMRWKVGLGIIALFHCSQAGSAF
jgi:hypothetical protein